MCIVLLDILPKRFNRGEPRGAFCLFFPVQEERKRVKHEIIYDLKNESFKTLQNCLTYIY